LRDVLANSLDDGGDIDAEHEEDVIIARRVIIRHASAALDKKRAAIFRSPPNLAIEAGLSLEA
jgi:hypothetical protein